MVSSERSAAAARLSYPPGLTASQVLADCAILPAQPAAVSLSVPSQRVAGIDFLRIMAAVGIIWFHTEGAPYALIGYAGLPAFLLIYFSLVIKQSRAHTTGEFVRRRWDRLLKPWLFWSAAYGLCRVIKAAHTMDVSSIERMFSVETLLVGTRIHLWYLPYAFASGLLLHVLNRRIRETNDLMVVFAATFLGISALAAGAISLQTYHLAPPLPQWEFGLAALPLGLAVGRALTIPSRRTQMLLLSVVCTTTVGTSAILTSLGWGSTAIPYSLAMLLVCLAYGWQINGNGLIATVAPLTLGMYLLHPLVICGLTQFLPAEGHYAAFVILAACVSGAVTWALMQTPLRRFI
jgi:peptidoglycan/LPS O-acetylase OafA/YrhL